MANYYLDRNGTYELGFSSSSVTVYGTSGTQDHLLLRGNASDVVVGTSVEIVDFYGALSEYVFRAGAGAVEIFRGNLKVASVGSNANGGELRFADGGISLTQDPETGAMLLGGDQRVDTVRAAYSGAGLDTSAEHRSAVEIEAGAVELAGVADMAADAGTGIV